MHNYYDIDQILSEEENVPVTFLREAPGLGFLDGTGGTNDVEMGAEMDINLWMVSARDLLLLIASAGLYGEEIIDVKLPKQYNKSYRSKLKAEPTITSFARYPYYYAIGKEISLLLGDMALLQVLMIAFSGRYIEILDHCHSWRNEDLSLFTRKLSLFEAELFYKGYNASLDFENWKDYPREHLRASALTILDLSTQKRDNTRKKRKIELLEENNEKN